MGSSRQESSQSHHDHGDFAQQTCQEHKPITPLWPFLHCAYHWQNPLHCIQTFNNMKHTLSPWLKIYKTFLWMSLWPQMPPMPMKKKMMI